MDINWKKWICQTLFSSFKLLPLSLYWWNKYSFPPTNLYNKTLNHNLPAPSLKDKTWKFLNGRKAPFFSLLFSPVVAWGGPPLSISIKRSSFMIFANGDSGGIQLANTQTFSLLDKTAAAIVNKTITDCRRLPSISTLKKHFDFKHVNDLYSSCKWNNCLNQRL